MIRARFIVVAATRPAELIPAIKYGGKVYRGSDHDYILDRLPDGAINDLSYTKDFGYLSETHRFYNRADAMDYAIENNLLTVKASKRSKSGMNLTTDQLQSWADGDLQGITG